jgi:hypothetical protein
MDELKDLVERYSNDGIRKMEDMMIAAEKLFDNIRYAERKIKLRSESQQMWINGFDQRNPKYDHDIEISQMAKKRLKYSFESLLMEMYQSTKKM